MEIPLGVLTAVLGTPLFLWLLAARKRVVATVMTPLGPRHLCAPWMTDASGPW